eukprot:Nk52_evm10s366 gene=Nk52_evmTU10s366
MDAQSMVPVGEEEKPKTMKEEEGEVGDEKEMHLTVSSREEGKENGATEEDFIYPLPPKSQLRPIVYVPPLNFGVVIPGVYRSGYPNRRNFPFLEKLSLKTILYMDPESYLPDNLAFCQNERIRFVQFPILRNKEPFVETQSDLISQCLALVLDKANHPILVHCHKGKHRTGCLVGCLRKLQNWSLTSIFDEYQRLAGPQIVDQQFIELFEMEQHLPKDRAPPWL